MKAAKIILMLLGGPTLLWLASGKIPPSASRVFTCANFLDHQPYVVPVENEQASLHLSFQEHERYLLVLNSLGNAHETYKVELTNQVSKERSPSDLTPLAPLEPYLFGIGALPLKSAGLTKTIPDPAVETREFWLHVTEGNLDDEKNYTLVTAKLIAVGHRVAIYLDEQQNAAHLQPEIAAEILSLVETDLLPKAERLFGEIRDVDEDGRFTILLTPWLSRLQGGKTSLGGFVRGSDFRALLPKPFSNQCEMLYLNSNLKAGEELRTLLAHEITHAICFSQRLPVESFPEFLPDEEDWLNEAIAHLAENLLSGEWSNLDYRISRFLNSPENYPLVVKDYFRSGLWRNHGCRGATYLFLRWCVDQYGVELLPRMIGSSACGAENFERQTGVRFADLFRAWSVALWEGGQRDSGVSDIPVHSGYRSIPLRGEFSGWGLAGPRVHQWKLDESPLQIQLRGTSSAYVEVSGPEVSQTLTELTIQSEYGAHLQVTLIPLEHDQEPVDFKTAWTTQSTSLDTRDTPTLTLTFPASAGKPEWVACEWHDDQQRKSVFLPASELSRKTIRDGDQITVNLSNLQLPRWAKTGVMKVLFRNEDGSSTTAWSTLPQPDPPIIHTVAKPSSAAN